MTGFPPDPLRIVPGSNRPFRPPPDAPEWKPWFERHADHTLVGKMVGHPRGCNRRCLDDAPGRQAA